MPIIIKFIGAIRRTAGKTQISVDFEDAMSLKVLIKRLWQRMPEFKKVFIDKEANEQQSNALILVNGREISVLNGLETKLTDGDEVVFIPVVHGG